MLNVSGGFNFLGVRCCDEALLIIRKQVGNNLIYVYTVSYIVLTSFPVYIQISQSLILVPNGSTAPFSGWVGAAVTSLLRHKHLSPTGQETAPWTDDFLL